MVKKILLSLLVLSFLGGEILRFTIYSHISFRMLDLVVVSIAIVLVVDLISSPQKRQVFLFPGVKWIVGFISIGIFSLLINMFHFSIVQLGEGALYLIRWILYTAVFFYFSDSQKEEKNFLLSCMSVIGGLLVLIGFIQYFYYNNLRNLYYLGWDDHMYRIFSSFLDPNFTGILFTLFSIFIMGRIWTERTKNTSLTWIYVFFLGISLVATVLTFSRSALIALAIGSVVFLTLIGKKRYFLYLVGVMVGMLLLTVPFFYIENVNLFRAASTHARLESAENALTIIKDNFLTGVGFNTYRYAQVKYGFRHGIGADVSHADSGTDNSYLFVLATTGIFGLLLYGGYLRSLLLYGWEYLKVKKSYYPAVYIASLCAVMVDSLFINSLFYPFILVWMWLLLSTVNYK